jgi:cytochrome c oxidase subunit II
MIRHTTHLTKSPGLARSVIAIGLTTVTVVVALDYQAFAWRARYLQTPGRPILPSPLMVEVKGENGRWHVLYPGADGKLETPDDVRGGQDIHLPARTRVRLELRSGDAIYFFGVPALGLNEAAAPDLRFALEFDTGQPGVFDVRQDQICGSSHPDLEGRLVVERVSEFTDWLEQLAKARPAQLSGR